MFTVLVQSEKTIPSVVIENGTRSPHRLVMDTAAVQTRKCEEGAVAAGVFDVNMFRGRAQLGFLRMRRWRIRRVYNATIIMLVTGHCMLCKRRVKSNRDCESQH